MPYKNILMRAIKLQLLLVVILLYSFLPQSPALAQDSSWVTQEIRYRATNAQEVFVVWGVNGWQKVESNRQPPETIVDGQLMRTPMIDRGDFFSAKLQVPKNARLDYTFQVTQTQSGQIAPGTELDNKFQIRNSENLTTDFFDALGRQRHTYSSIADRDGSIEIKAIYSSSTSNRIGGFGFKSTNLLLLLLSITITVVALNFNYLKQLINQPQNLNRLIRVAMSKEVQLIQFLIINRLFLIGIGCFSYASYFNGNVKFLPLDYHSIDYLKQLLSSFDYGDAKSYISIAENGYEHRPFSLDKQANWAFYPLFPIVLKLFSVFIENPLVAAFVLNNLFFVFSVICFYRLILLDYKHQVARLATILMILFPGSYFCLRPGPESLFLLLTITSIYAARRDKWTLSSILGALAVLARLQGLLLFPTLLGLYYRQHKISKIQSSSAWSLLLIPAAQISFMFYLYYLTGNFFAGFQIQRLWGHSLSVPFRPVLDFLIRPSLISYYSWDFSLVSILFSTGGFALVILMTLNKKVPLEYKIYSGLNILLIISRNTGQASLRLIFLVYPLYLMLSVFILQKSTLRDLVFFIFIALQTFYFLGSIYHYNWACT